MKTKWYDQRNSDGTGWVVLAQKTPRIESYLCFAEVEIRFSRGKEQLHWKSHISGREGYAADIQTAKRAVRKHHRYLEKRLEAARQ